MTTRRLTVAAVAAISGLSMLAPAVLAAPDSSVRADAHPSAVRPASTTGSTTERDASGAYVDGAGQPPFGAVSSETATAAAPTILPARRAAAPATGNVIAATGDVLAAPASVGGAAASATGAVLGLFLRPLRIRA